MKLTGNTELLSSLQDCLLTQADVADIDSIQEAASRPGSGLVLVGVNAIAAAVNLRNEGFPQPIIVDRRRYSGKKRALGTARFDRSWLTAQNQLGLPAILTDSGYIGEDDFQALNSVLTQTAELGPGAVATLPLHVSWLQRNEKHLTTAIREATVPVALVLEHDRDPLGAKATLFGLVELLRSVNVPVMLLSCDVSALGAIAFGAYMAAVGTRAGLRHLYPITGGGPTDEMESAFVRGFLAFYKVGKIVTDLRGSW